MSDIPVFRLALKDSTHPMYSIAWDIFRAKFNPDKVAKRHGECRDEVLPFLYEILDAEELYAQESLGNGFAPINTLCLLVVIRHG